MSRILLVEDDESTATFIARSLEEIGHHVERANNGPDGLFRATDTPFDAIILDRMLPGLEGLGVLRALRAAGVKSPILILSALGSLDERVRGLNAGSDDYLTKPFAFSELQARLTALLRRPAATDESAKTWLSCADLKMDLLTRKVTRSGQVLPLQPREFRLLEFLLRHQNQVVTRTMLLEGVWDYHFDPQTNVIDVHISRLRQKIDRDFAAPLLHTVRGSGYMLSEKF